MSHGSKVDKCVKALLGRWATTQWLVLTGHYVGFDKGREGLTANGRETRLG